MSVDPRQTLIVVTCALALAGCSPTFDWRDTRLPEADGAEALFPCKPERATRPIRLAGNTVAFGLASCAAGSLTFALGHAELPDAAQAATAMQALQDVAASNVGGLARVIAAPRLIGVPTDPAPRRIEWQGHRADGSLLQEDAVFFMRGSHVYQASVVGTKIDKEVVDTFFEGLKLP